IVILTRNTRDNENYRRLLSEAELPVFVNNRSGYLDTLEIRTMIRIFSAMTTRWQAVPRFGMMGLRLSVSPEERFPRFGASTDQRYNGGGLLVGCICWI